MFIFIRKNGYYASQKRLCKQLVLRGGIFIAFSKRQFEVKKFLKIQLYQYVREWLDTGKKFSGLIKKSACLLLPLNIEGISGTRADTRPGLQRLMADCRLRRIDMVLTKSCQKHAGLSQAHKSAQSAEHSGLLREGINQHT